MLAEKILGNLADYPLNERKLDYVMLEWYEFDKKLLRKTSENGVEVGIRVDTHLHEGDVLYADEKLVMAVGLLPCDLTVIPVHTMQEMGRLGFELGNRHLSLAIEEDKVSIPYDEPTFLYLQKLGYQPQRAEGKFAHFTVCHAHGHTHGAEGHHHEA